MGRSSQPESQRTARGFGLLVTNLIKLGGLILGMNEGLFHSTDRNAALIVGLAALMVSGGISIDRLLDRLFGK
jgi:hypothetical protein